MFSCNLCGGESNEYVYFERHCSKCIQIRRIISLYTLDNVLETLRFVYLRDDNTKVDNRCENQYHLRSMTSREKNKK